MSWRTGGGRIRGNGRGGRPRRGIPAAFALFVLLLTTGCGGGARPAGDAAGQAEALPDLWKGHRVVLSDTAADGPLCDTVRFGRLGSGEIARLPLLVENRTRRPVAVSGYTRTCGCTTLEYDGRPIAPGGARLLALRFDTRGERGWQLKRVEVYLSGVGRPLLLFVEADVQ